MNAGEAARAVRRGAGLFRCADRAVLEVRGSDRRRWLQGMLSNDIEALAPGSEASGCPAALLNHRAGVVALFQVALRSDALWLECDRAVLAIAAERLAKFIVADDVELVDRSESLVLLGLEGPRAGDWLAAAAGLEEPPPLAPHAVCELPVAGVAALLGAWGQSGERAYRIAVPAEDGETVRAAIRAASGPGELVDSSLEVLDILRIEAGLPRMESELGEDVLPDEAGLETAVSDAKGCYTGQEIVARLRSRGHVNHLLVGLRFAGASPPAPGTELEVAGRSVGEVTSVCVSPDEGPIGLGFVRRTSADPGTGLEGAGGRVEVATLPFPVATQGL